ncbi:MAG: hypothetical protein LBM06_06500, partial [Prevotellaceae bacterium]|nr:hypothetical protein [Prevotellaceae bacterium]
IALLAAQVVKEVPSVVSELKSLGFAAALEIPQLLKTGANLTMTGQVLPLVISQIKDNQEKLAYKRANEAQEAEELPTDSIPEGSAPSDGISSAQ